METLKLMFKIIAIKEKFTREKYEYCEIKSGKLGWDEEAVSEINTIIKF